MAAIEVLCKSQNGGKRLNRSLPTASQRTVAIMAPTGLGTAMIACNESDCLDLVGLESSQIAVLYQVIRMFVMAFVGDVHADVVQDCGVFQPVALAVAKPMHAASLIEQRKSESSHLTRVLWPVVVALGELDHAAAPDVGIALDSRDLFPMSRDVIQKQPLPQREIAERQLFGAQSFEDRFEKDCAGDGEIGSSWIEARYSQPLFEGQRRKLLTDPVQLLQRHPAVAQ
jgi:hypothetical protein